MKLYMVKFNGVGYQTAECVFISRKEAIFFLEETLGMKAFDDNIWIDPLKDMESGWEV